MGHLGHDVAAAQELTLALPHPLRDGETAGIEVHVGPIVRGRVVTVTTAPHPVVTGQGFAYTITTANTGAAKATGLTMTVNVNGVRPEAGARWNASMNSR